MKKTAQFFKCFQERKTSKTLPAKTVRPIFVKPVPRVFF